MSRFRARFLVEDSIRLLVQRHLLFVFLLVVSGCFRMKFCFNVPEKRRNDHSNPLIDNSLSGCGCSTTEKHSISDRSVYGYLHKHLFHVNFLPLRLESHTNQSSDLHLTILERQLFTMKLSCEPMFILHAIALTTIVVHGSVRETDALIHKPKVLRIGPSSSRATVWASTHSKRMPLSSSASQEYTARQREQSKKSMEMTIAHGNIGIQRLERKSLASPPFRRFVIASILAVVAVWKIKAVIALLQYPGWFLSSMLYKPYQNSLVENPLITKVLTGAVLAVAGDAVAQSTSTDQSKAGYDKRRALSFAVFDSCYRFFQHNMFPIVIRLGQGNVIKSLLPKIIPSKTIADFFTPAAAAIEQTAMYQFIIVPVSTDIL